MTSPCGESHSAPAGWPGPVTNTGPSAAEGAGSAVTVSLDAQGRLALPPVLRQFAGIEHEVMVVGIGPRVEIWSKASWDRYEAQVSDELLEEYARKAGL